MTRCYELAIVGAGPAGLAAAAEAAALGVSTVLIDEQPRHGGQIYRNVEYASGRVRSILGPDYAYGKALVERFRKAACDYLPSATLAYISDDLELTVVSDARLVSIQCERLLVAVGAIERPFPVAGWTLPGVVAAGGVQAMLKSQGLVPDGPVAIAGTGPLAYLIAVQLLNAGVKLSFLDTVQRSNYGAATKRLPRALGAAHELWKGLRMLAQVRRQAEIYVPSVTSLAIEGDDSGKTVCYAVRDGSARTLHADWIMLHQGVVPNTHITQALRCDHHWDDDQLCWQPRVDAWGATSVKRVLVAGDCVHIGGARAAESSGALAALQVAFETGRLSGADRDSKAAPLRRDLRRRMSIRGLLDALYRPPDAFRVPSGEVLVCRCEDVSAREIVSAIGLGCIGPNQAKFFTRCGMGPCQGRYCGLTVSEMIARHTGRPMAGVGHYRIRQPLKPVPLGLLAATPQPIDTETVRLN